jgi:anti-sigma factor RsiW
MDDMGSIVMKCPIETQENAELLLAYCARKLDPETQITLERHLAICPACREFQTSQQAVCEALDAWDAMPVSADFDRRLYQRIEQEAAHASWWSRLVQPFRPMFEGSMMGRSVPLAAAACLLVLAGIILQQPNGVSVSEDLTVDRAEVIQVDQVERALDDMEMLRQFKLTTSGDSSSVNSM